MLHGLNLAKADRFVVSMAGAWNSEFRLVLKIVYLPTRRHKLEANGLDDCNELALTPTKVIRVKQLEKKGL